MLVGGADTGVKGTVHTIIVHYFRTIVNVNQIFLSPKLGTWAAVKRLGVTGSLRLRCLDPALPLTESQALSLPNPYRMPLVESVYDMDLKIVHDYGRNIGNSESIHRCLCMHS